MNKTNRKMDESSGSLLCTEAHKGVPLEYYADAYVPQWDEIVARHGHVRLLFLYPDPHDFTGWDERAAAMDFARHTERGKEVTCVALINAPEKVRARWKILQNLVGGPVREFMLDELDAALAWARSDLENADEARNQ